MCIHWCPHDLPSDMCCRLWTLKLLNIKRTLSLNPRQVNSLYSCQFCQQVITWHALISQVWFVLMTTTASANFITLWECFSSVSSHVWLTENHRVLSDDITNGPQSDLIDFHQTIKGMWNFTSTLQDEMLTEETILEQWGGRLEVWNQRLNKFRNLQQPRR
jgi:hypothetical protein